MSATIVTVRYLVDNTDLQDFIHQINNDAKHDKTCIDHCVQKHAVPAFIEDSIVNEQYVEGELTRPIHVMVRTDAPCYLKQDGVKTTEHKEDAGIFYAWSIPANLKPYHYLAFA